MKVVRILACAVVSEVVSEVVTGAGISRGAARVTAVVLAVAALSRRNPVPERAAPRSCGHKLIHCRCWVRRFRPGESTSKTSIRLAHGQVKRSRALGITERRMRP